MEVEWGVGGNRRASLCLLPHLQSSSMSLRLVLVVCALLACSISLVSGARGLALPVEGRIQVPGGYLPVGNQEITLNGDEYSTLTRSDGSFTFYDIPTGVYLLDVSDIRAIYPQMKIKLSAENGTVTVVEYKYLGAKRIPADYPMLITAIMPTRYFQTKPPISVIGLITGNPMMIMMLFALVVIVAFPNMLSGLSPEDMAELKKSQASAGDPMKELSKLMGVAQPEAKDEDDD